MNEEDVMKFLEEEKLKAERLPRGDRQFRKRGVHEFVRNWQDHDNDDNDQMNIFNNDAVNLFARRGFDVEKGIRNIEELQDMEFDIINDIELTNIVGHLDKVDDEIIIGKIYQTRKDSEAEVKRMQKRWTAMNWSNAKKEFMESLGHVSHKWKGSSNTASKRKEVQTVSDLSNDSGLQLNTSLNAINDFMGFTSSSDMQQNEEDDIKEAHAKIVRKLNYEAHKIPSSTNDNRYRPLQEFSLIVQDFIAKSKFGFMAEQDISDYKVLLNMLSEMVGEGTTTPAPPGNFSLICFGSNYDKKNIIDNKHGDLSKGAKKHFENQYWELISTRVDNLLRSYRVILEPSDSSSVRLRIIRAYIRHLWQSGAFPDTIQFERSEKNYPRWAVVYYCLRCGDIIGARDELYGNDPVENNARLILDCLARNSLNEPDLMYRMDECRKEFAHNSPDPFKKYVLNLLGLVDQESLLDINITELTEDFLWGHLWFIFWNREHKRNIGNEADLFDRIIGYGGSNHFDENGLIPFTYAVILVTCHRFGDAIAYLWDRKKTIPAVHLTIACLYYSLILPSQELTENPPSNAQIAYTRGITPRMILEYYCRAPFNLYFPEKVADYYISLDSNWNSGLQGIIDMGVITKCQRKSEMEIEEMFIQLLVSSGADQLEKLVGKPDERGVPNVKLLDTSLLRNFYRTAGRLDDYMKGKDIINLLDAAGDRLKEQHRFDASMHLYTLAGQFTKVIEEFCRKLSDCIMPQSLNRDFWLKFAVGFHEQYIKGGYGLVKGSLEKEGKEYLQKTLEILINTCSFMDLFVDHRHRDALDLIDQLQLVPTSTDNYFNSFVENYRKLDKIVQEVIMKNIIPKIVKSTEIIKNQIEMEQRNTTMDKIHQLQSFKELIKKRYEAAIKFKETLQY